MANATVMTPEERRSLMSALSSISYAGHRRRTVEDDDDDFPSCHQSSSKRPFPFVNVNKHDVPGSVDRTTKKRKKEPPWLRVSAFCFICGCCDDVEGGDDVNCDFLSSFGVPWMKNEILSPGFWASLSGTLDKGAMYLGNIEDICSSCATALRMMKSLQGQMEELKESVDNLSRSIRAVVKMRIEADAVIKEKDGNGIIPPSAIDKNIMTALLKISEVWNSRNEAPALEHHEDTEPFPIFETPTIKEEGTHSRNFCDDEDENSSFPFEFELGPETEREPEDLNAVVGKADETRTPSFPVPNATKGRKSKKIADPQQTKSREGQPSITIPASNATQNLPSPMLSAINPPTDIIGRPYRPILPRPPNMLSSPFGDGNFISTDHPLAPFVKKGIDIASCPSALLAPETLVLLPNGYGLLFQSSNAGAPATTPLPSPGSTSIPEIKTEPDTELGEPISTSATTKPKKKTKPKQLIPPIKIAPTQTVTATLKLVPGPDGAPNLSITYPTIAVPPPLPGHYCPARLGRFRCTSCQDRRNTEKKLKAHLKQHKKQPLDLHKTG